MTPFQARRARPLPLSVRLASPGLAAALILLSGGCSHKAPPPQPVSVTVTPAEQRDIPVQREWIASLYGSVDAQVRAQVAGYLVRQDYEEGTRVHRGDLLFEIDPRPFRAALAEAQGNLAQAEANATKTRDDARRYIPLAQKQAISQQEMDDAVQAELAARAQVVSARAAVEQAKLNLAFTRIVSPIDGTAGLIQAQIGDLVGPGTGPLATVSTLNPIKAYFPISEADYLDFARQNPGADGFPPEAKLELILADGSSYPLPGKFYAADRQIDPSTGTLRIAATFPNPHRFLRPGQTGRIRATVRTLKGAIVVPARALNSLQGGYQIAVVGQDNVAHFKMVQVGPQIGDDAVIEGNAIAPGESVIVDGFLKVQEGSKVDPQPYQPESAPAPAS